MKFLSICVATFMMSVATPALANSSEPLVSVASSYIGKNPTNRKYLWCADFVDLALKKAGYKPINSSASAAVKKLKRVKKKDAKKGDLIYMSRRGGGHTEIFAGWANSSKTKYVAVTGNSCGKKGKRYVCKRTRSLSRVASIHRPVKLAKAKKTKSNERIVVFPSLNNR